MQSMAHKWAQYASTQGSAHRKGTAKDSPLPHQDFGYAVDQTLFKMTQEELDKLYIEYKVPKSIRFVVPRPDDLPSNPPTSHITIYKDCLKNGLRFPFDLFLRKAFIKFSICPT